MPFVHEGIRGIADFLRRVDDADGDGFTWEPIDAKLARNAAKPGHVLQLCFYAEAIEATTGRLPELMRIELGSGRPRRVRVADVLAYWRRLRGQLATLLARKVRTSTRGPSRATTASSASSSSCARTNGARPIRSCTWPVFVPPIA
jgi:predicted RecB family nuclease